MPRMMRSASFEAIRRADADDFVWSIAKELQPWTRSQREVLAEVRKTIGELREDLAYPPATGFRAENRQVAKDCIAILEQVTKLLYRLPPTFIESVARTNFFDETLAIRCAADLEQFWHRGGQESRQLQNEVKELRERTAKFAEQCKRAIFAPIRLVDDSGKLVDRDCDPRGVTSIQRIQERRRNLIRRFCCTA
jgi:hypothetical protein